VLALRAIWCGRMERRTGLQRIWQSSPDVAIHLLSLMGDSQRAAGEWVISGTLERPYGDMPATRRRFEVRGATFLTLVDGLVQLQVDYWDLSTLLRQLGLVPPSAPG
jgi:steroid delta-isomerase-like uncharacterized protein